MDIKKLFDILSDSEKELIYLISKDWKANELTTSREIDAVNSRFLLMISNGKMSKRLISAILLNFKGEIIDRSHLLGINTKKYRNIGPGLLHELHKYLYTN